jgi:hypothetical protein
MVAGIFGAAGSHNDVGVLNLSHHTEYLEELLFLDYVMAGGLLPALFGYSIFQNVNHSTIIARYNAVGLGINKAEFIRRWNFRLSSVQQSIEHMYGQLVNLFHLLKVPRHFKLFSDGQLAYRVAVVCFFMLNCYACLNGSPCNSMFDTIPPSLDEYLPLDEALQPYVPNDDIMYDFYILE